MQIRGEYNSALFHLYRAIAAIEAAKKDHGGPLSVPPDEPWHGAGLMKPKGLERIAFEKVHLFKGDPL